LIVKRYHALVLENSDTSQIILKRAVPIVDVFGTYQIK
jgi:hypothetical protein